MQRCSMSTQLLLLLLLLLVSQSTTGTGQLCQQVLRIRGANTRGTFASENFPHALPVGSRCGYEFQAYPQTGANAICLLFRELDLFTVNGNSADETQVLLRTRHFIDPFLVYAGNGSRLRESSEPHNSVITRPDNLLAGPLCLTTWNTYILEVINYQFLLKGPGRVTRFLAEYAAVDTDRLGDWMSPSKHVGLLHRCLDDNYINRNKRCNAVKDCNPSGNHQHSDFFSGVSSDESYEHARCNSSGSFGTNFALGQASAHRLTGSVSIECGQLADHSRHFNDRRDCGLVVPRRPADVSESNPLMRLGGIRTPASSRPACYRFHWRSVGFDSPDESLTLMLPGDGRALLRLDGRPTSDNWHLVELQTDVLKPGDLDWINVFSLRPPHRTGAGPRHLLDDLSAEPAACNASAYESRMPAVCSFEWSTCGWESSMPVVTDASVANEHRVSFSDHTADSTPGRPLPPRPQRVLRLLPGSNDTGRLESRRRLPYGSSWCLGVWFYGLGDRGYSVRLETRTEVRVAGDTTTTVLMTMTAPTNQWRLLTISIEQEFLDAPDLTVRLQVPQHSQLRLVLLDDISITEGACLGYGRERNGTVECGNLEWRCTSRLQCVPLRHRCDGVYHCEDGSDEVNCLERGGSDRYWSLILRVTIGVVVIVSAFVLLSLCLRRRASQLRSRSHPGAPRTVSDGRLPASLGSDRRRPDMPPSYRDVAQGAANAGFAVLEDPPKYDEVVSLEQLPAPAAGR